MACIYCGEIGNLVDHVVPYRLGGPSIEGNGVVCCLRCNARKAGDRWVDFIDLAFRHLAEHGADLTWLDRGALRGSYRG